MSVGLLALAATMRVYAIRDWHNTRVHDRSGVAASVTDRVKTPRTTNARERGSRNRKILARVNLRSRPKSYDFGYDRGVSTQPGALVAAKSITPHARFDLLRPGVDSAGDVADGIETVGAKKFRHAPAANSGMAEDEQVLVARKAVDLFGDLPHRDVLGALDVANL